MDLTDIRAIAERQQARLDEYQSLLAILIARHGYCIDGVAHYYMSVQDAIEARRQFDGVNPSASVETDGQIIHLTAL